MSMQSTRGAARRQAKRPRALSAATDPAAPSRPPKKKSIACHAQKIRCSGGMPCAKCQSGGYGEQCRYVSRDRMVRVSESYLEQLRSDSQELHERRTRTENESDERAVANVARQTQAYSSKSPNTLPSEISMSDSHSDPILPIHIGETAGTVFAARVCQCLTGSDTSTHPLRWNYVDESDLAAFLKQDITWPKITQAKILVQTALTNTNPAFHVALRKDTFQLLDEVYRKKRFNNASIKSKYFALFALGQLYSAFPSVQNSHVPGSAYFAHALSLMRIPPERPSMMHLETMLSVALFYQHLNRFHSAYLLVGNALRLGLSFRLNHNTSNSGLSAVESEHRVRLWWSIYTMDRFWGLKSGLPVQINDDDIYLGLPTNLALDSDRDQFSDPALQIACIRLARLAGNISQDLYRPSTAAETFIQREQKLLVRSREWIEELPDNLKLLPGGISPKTTTVMHLQFNYCIMLAISPALLHMLSTQHDTSPNAFQESAALAMIWETGVHAAKHSLALCVECWTTGAIGMFSYDFPTFLFTAALALLVCSFLQTKRLESSEAIDTAKEILSSLRQSGNLSARDFLDHLSFVINCFEQASQQATSKVDQQHNNSTVFPHGSGHQFNPTSFDTELHAIGNFSTSISDTNSITMQTAFSQASMQTFLGQDGMMLQADDSLNFLNDPVVSFWWLEKPLYTE
ncbi:hypothetical protein NLG97_g4865 [Lecanicillium saksenae]|uniref:Uncharacterized protein n=1 Tax=Lecanicillium saksenae TaxID=468837 RepID=A0ACC1QVR3_9HYPO|nr:hypothetical protein NLG97_g4865 [Lecanicillium saksenae]